QCCSYGPSQILFAGLLDFLRSESFSRDLRRFDQCGPFVDLALDEYSGDLRSGATKTELNSLRRSSVAGALIAATVALWSFCTIAAGVPLGKTKENQAPASKLATPCSCADARFGRVGERFFVRTAIAFTELPWMCGIASSAAGH